MWKTINTNSNYCINQYGQIKSLYTNKLMTPQIDQDGYLYIRLYDNKTKKFVHKRIHRLVLEHFNRAPKEGEECHHKDNNRQNNNIDNLEWVTRQENDSHVNHVVNDGSYEPIAVVQLDLNNNFIAEFKSMSEAARQTNSQVSKISLVCNGKRHTHNGYKWRIKQ